MSQREIMEGGSAIREAERRAKLTGKPIHVFKVGSVYRFSIRKDAYTDKNYVATVEPPRGPVLKNRQLVVAGIYLSDVANALKEKNIPLTEQNIEAAARHVESVASAWAKAVLQDTGTEEWHAWIETFGGAG
jgi:hypothetical protein